MRSRAPTTPTAARTWLHGSPRAQAHPLTCDGSFVRDLAVQVEIMKLVQHQYVVSILNFHQTWSASHIVMELLPGGDLYTQVISRYWSAEDPTGYSEREVREIMRMALSGLEALHHHRVIHRDLKVCMSMRMGMWNGYARDDKVAPHLTGRLHPT